MQDDEAILIGFPSIYSTWQEHRVRSFLFVTLQGTDSVIRQAWVDVSYNLSSLVNSDTWMSTGNQELSLYLYRTGSHQLTSPELYRVKLKST